MQSYAQPGLQLLARKRPPPGRLSAGPLGQQKRLNFGQKLKNWLNQGLRSELPNEIKAFSFNLFEPAQVDGVKFGVELIGAGKFDENDPDWACDEIWEPEQQIFYIPVEYSSDN